MKVKIYKKENSKYAGCLEIKSRKQVERHLLENYSIKYNYFINDETIPVSIK